MRCPTCAKGSIIEINMCVSGSDLTFRRCGHCEAQTWEAAEGVVPLTRVLELVRAP
jgi:DNA polymerase III alpha subunit (gram-positive type)